MHILHYFLFLSEKSPDFRSKTFSSPLIFASSTSKINKSFTDGFVTVAFQIAYFNAFYSYCEGVMKMDGVDFYDSNKIENALNAFLDSLNKKGLKFWINFLTEFKSSFIGNLDPKVWPTFHKLILRVIQPKNEFYTKDDYSPEVYFYETHLKKNIQALLNNKYGNEQQALMTVSDLTKNHKDEINSIVESVENRLKDTYKIIGIKPLDFNRVNSLEKVKKLILKK